MRTLSDPPTSASRGAEASPRRPNRTPASRCRVRPIRRLLSRRSIFTVPPMIAALGAAGHDDIEPAWLRDLAWQRDAMHPDGELVWEGIAGKRGRQTVPDDETGHERPTLAVDGPQEYIHSCFRALAESDSHEFRSARPGGVLVTVQTMVAIRARGARRTAVIESAWSRTGRVLREPGATKTGRAARLLP